MTVRPEVQRWIVEALEKLGGTGSIAAVAKEIWDAHEPDLRTMGDYFYTWQYEIRWEAQRLQDNGALVKGKAKGGKGEWALKKP